MLEVPFSDEEASLACRRSEECTQRLEATALTPTAWERGLEYEPESRFVAATVLWETLPKLGCAG